MDLKLRLRIKTPYGDATKIKVNDDGEITFVMSVERDYRDLWGVRRKVEKEFSLGECRIYVEEEEEDLGE